MENNQKIVKKITKPVIFTLCCVLILGVLYLPINAYNVGDIVTVGVTGYISDDCYVAIVGEDHQVDIQGVVIQANLSLTFNTNIYQPQYDINGNPYLELIAYTSTGGDVRCTYKLNGESHTVNVPAYDFSAVDLPVGATNISLHIINYDDSDILAEHIVYINLVDNDEPSLDNNNSFIIDFDKTDFTVSNNFVLLYEGGRLMGDVTSDETRLTVDTITLPPKSNEEGLYYTLYLSNVPIGSYLGIRKENDVITGYGGAINNRNETFLVHSSSLNGYRFIVDYGTSTQIMDEVEITIYFNSNIVDDYDAGYADGYREGQKYGESLGFDKGYDEGFKSNDNNFIKLLFSPITAMHSAVLYDLNGTADGGEISIGLIFWTMLGIALFTAFMRYFAGG